MVSVDVKHHVYLSKAHLQHVKPTLTLPRFAFRKPMVRRLHYTLYNHDLQPQTCTLQRQLSPYFFFFLFVESATETEDSIAAEK